MRTPELEEITSFPFINDHSVSNTGNDPMAILNAMTSSSPAWVTPTKDSYWFAAGLSLVAFDILTVAAVAMVQFRDAGLIISIIADAVAQMPPSVTSRSEMIAYVELGFICELNTIDGYFRVEAALAPTSFLLVPSCHIYGGMALVYWFHVSWHSSGDVTKSLPTDRFCSQTLTLATGCSRSAATTESSKSLTGIPRYSVWEFHSLSGAILR